MPDGSTFSGDEAAQLVAGRIAGLGPSGGRPRFVGLNGAQGSGKSTIARSIAEALGDEHGLSCATVSLDDFYLGRQARADLAASVHPLCATRGVPGTHDLVLMQATIAALSSAGPDDQTPLPRFDKLADDRLPRGRWDAWHGRPDCLLLEGWCVGVRRDDLPHWTGPINALEAEHDPKGEWHAWSRAALAGYEPIWDAIDLLVSIEVPDLATVIDSRLKQEQGLAAASGRPTMDRAGVTRFVEHYERYTRALWSAMRQRADLLLRRDADFRFTLVE